LYETLIPNQSTMRRILLITLLVSSVMATAQFGKNCELRQFKLNIVNPGIEYEMAVGVNTTIDLKLGAQLTIDPSVKDVYSDFDVIPAAAAQFRYYYNFEKRQRKRKQVYGNSANYVAPALAVFAPVSLLKNKVEDNNTFGYVGMVTGLQRSYNSGFNFSFDVGAGYYVGTFNNAIYPVANLSIGWILNEKRWCVGK